MDGLGFKNNLKGRLKFWTFHCLINALPSYLIVMIWLGQFGNPTSHIAMLSAVFTFVVMYSVVTSLPGLLAQKDSLPFRALRVGLILRMICSMWTVLFLFLGPIVIFTPDLWCGNIAMSFVDRLYEFFGHETNLRKMFDGNTKDGVLIQPGFMEIYLITLLEGLILSFMLFVFSVMAIVILQMRDRKKMFLKSPDGLAVNF